MRRIVLAAIAVFCTAAQRSFAGTLIVQPDWLASGTRPFVKSAVYDAFAAESFTL